MNSLIASNINSRPNCENNSTSQKIAEGTLVDLIQSTINFSVIEKKKPTLDSAECFSCLTHSSGQKNLHNGVASNQKNSIGPNQLNSIYPNRNNTASSNQKNVFGLNQINTVNSNLNKAINSNQNKAVNSNQNKAVNSNQNKAVNSNQNNAVNSSRNNATDSSQNNADNPNSENSEECIPPPKMVLYTGRIQVQWNEIKKIGAGLINMGNTCFLNTVLQCLAYCPPLANYLLCDNEHSTQCLITGFCMMCQLQRLIRRIIGRTGETTEPKEVYPRLKLIAKHFRYNQQEDAHEFLRYVIDNLWRSCLSQNSSYSKLDAASKETTVINQIFGGYHRSQVTCLRCRQKSNTFDHFMDLILDIKQNVGSLEKALEKFTQPEILEEENSYKCPKCKMKVTAQKRFTVYRAPNVATFQLKRFDYNRSLGGKITKQISYPEKLNLRPYMSDPKDDPVWYRLNAVLVHSGQSCNSGHYFCYVKNSNNMWYIMDDDKVHQVSLSCVLNQSAYVLFYTRLVPLQVSTVKKNCEIKTTVGKGSLSAENYKRSLEVSSKPLSVNESKQTNSVLKTINLHRLNMNPNREHISFGLKNNSLPNVQQAVQPKDNSSSTGLVPYVKDSSESSDDSPGHAQKKTDASYLNGRSSPKVVEVQHKKPVLNVNGSHKNNEVKGNSHSNNNHHPTSSSNRNCLNNGSHPNIAAKTPLCNGHSSSIEKTPTNSVNGSLSHEERVKDNVHRTVVEVKKSSPVVADDSPKKSTTLNNSPPQFQIKRKTKVIGTGLWTVTPISENSPAGSHQTRDWKVTESSPPEQQKGTSTFKRKCDDSTNSDVVLEIIGGPEHGLWENGVTKSPKRRRKRSESPEYEWVERTKDDIVENVNKKKNHHSSWSSSQNSVQNFRNPSDKKGYLYGSYVPTWSGQKPEHRYKEDKRKQSFAGYEDEYDLGRVPKTKSHKFFHYEQNPFQKFADRGYNYNNNNRRSWKNHHRNKNHYQQYRKYPHSSHFKR